MNMTRAKFMRHLDSTLGRSIRIFGEAGLSTSTSPSRRPRRRGSTSAPIRRSSRSLQRRSRSAATSANARPIAPRADRLPDQVLERSDGRRSETSAIQCMDHLAVGGLTSGGSVSHASYSEASRERKVVGRDVDRAVLRRHGAPDRGHREYGAGDEHRPRPPSWHSSAVVGGGDRPSPRRTTPIAKQSPDPQHLVIQLLSDQSWMKHK